MLPKRFHINQVFGHALEQMNDSRRKRQIAELFGPDNSNSMGNGVYF